MLADADVQAILKLLSEAEHVTEFRLRYGGVIIELRNTQPERESIDRGAEAPE